MPRIWTLFSLYLYWVAKSIIQIQKAHEAQWVNSKEPSPQPVTPKALYQTSMWHLKGVSTVTAPQCPKHSASQVNSHPHMASFHCRVWGFFFPTSVTSTRIWTSLSPQVPILPLPKRTCLSGSEVPQGDPSTSQLHLQSGLAVDFPSPASLSGAVW